ncbi:MAG: alanine--tRNA ligase [Planctomycetota bacterium]
MKTAREIRREFIDFFVERHGHTFVPSSPVVPLEDPTLMFANAGMNQFKDVFLGTGNRSFRRAANTQKCIRAGGKHNDLDDVGKDTYHHTFFEMLGNWSFGDYFKKEAIEWAWQLLTGAWGLDPRRLHATVFEGDPEQGVPRDEEAASLWADLTTIPKGHIHLGNRKDNFWEMGDTGPCGPCTEIHIDLTEDLSGGPLVNKGTPRCIEIWNLVFIQFNRGADGKLTPLPARHVDTGMGFERVSAVLQGKTSNYDIDLFQDLFRATRDLTGSEPYAGRLDDMRDTAYRVVADHIRALVFSLADGAVPSNEKRGYVVRSILRRAERYGRQYLGAKEPFLHRLVPAVVGSMGDVFPEIAQRARAVSKILLDEEEAFLRTLDRGMRLFNDVARRTKDAGKPVISGDDVFDLHTTYGLFSDITRQMAEEVGLGIDSQAYEKRMDEFRDTSGKDRKKLVISAIEGTLPRCDDSAKHLGTSANSAIAGWVTDNAVITAGTLATGTQAAIVLESTCFYPEQGGQVGDTGTITTPTGVFRVEDTQRLCDGILHSGVVESGFVEAGQPAGLAVDLGRRKAITRHHTSTHLMNWALRKVLGGAIDQKGSLVDAEKTRFDFAHDKALSAEEIQAVEDLVNGRILDNAPVAAVLMPLADAKKLPGVRAVFGEKYPDPVRVVTVAAGQGESAGEESSIEFCGGTHLGGTGEAGSFQILSQEAVGKGVRRLTAVAGEAALKARREQTRLLSEVAAKLTCKPEDAAERVDALREEVKKLQAQLKKAASGDLAGAADKILAEAATIGGTVVGAGEIPAVPPEQARIQLDRLRQKAGSSIFLLGWREEGKVGLLAAVSDDLHGKGIEAGKFVGEIAKRVGGKGGGPKGMAQAGGKETENLPAALTEAKALAAKLLGA